MTAPNSKKPMSQRGHNTRDQPADRGQSYPLGFLLILAVVIIGGLGLFAMGVNVLSGVTDGAKVNAAKAGMGDMRADFKEIASEGAPYREIQLQAVDGKLEFETVPDANAAQSIANTSTRISISVNSTDVSTNMSVWTRPIVYRIPSQDTSIVYSAGLIAQQYPGSEAESRLRKTPHFTASRSRTVFTIPALSKSPSSPNSIGMSGSGKVYVTGVRENSHSVRRVPTSDPTMTVTVNVSSIPPERVPVWVTYFEKSGFKNVTLHNPDGDSVRERVSAEIETESLYVQWTEIPVVFSSQT